MIKNIQLFASIKIRLIESNHAKKAFKYIFLGDFFQKSINFFSRSTSVHFYPIRIVNSTIEKQKYKNVINFLFRKWTLMFRFPSGIESYYFDPDLFFTNWVHLYQKTPAERFFMKFKELKKHLFFLKISQFFL